MPRIRQRQVEGGPFQALLPSRGKGRRERCDLDSRARVGLRRRIGAALKLGFQFPKARLEDSTVPRLGFGPGMSRLGPGTFRRRLLLGAPSSLGLG